MPKRRLGISSAATAAPRFEAPGRPRMILKVGAWFTEEWLELADGGSLPAALPLGDRSWRLFQRAGQCIDGIAGRLSGPDQESGIQLDAMAWHDVRLSTVSTAVYSLFTRLIPSGVSERPAPFSAEYGAACRTPTTGSDIKRSVDARLRGRVWLLHSRGQDRAPDAACSAWTNTLRRAHRCLRPRTGFD